MLYSRQIGWYWVRFAPIGNDNPWRTAAFAAHSAKDAQLMAQRGPAIDNYLADIGVFDVSMLNGRVQHRGDMLKIYPDGIICPAGDWAVDRYALVLWCEVSQQRVQWSEVAPEFVENLPDELILQSMLGYRERPW